MKRLPAVLAHNKGARVQRWARPHEGHDVNEFSESQLREGLSSAPGWNEDEASISEAIVKAERHSDDEGLARLQGLALRALHGPESTREGHQPPKSAIATS